MKNTAIIVGGLGIAAIAAFIIYKKKSDSSADANIADLESELSKSKDQATTDQEKADVEAAEKLLAEANKLEDTPEGKSKAKKIAEKLAKMAKRSPVGAVVRAQIAVAKRVSDIAKAASKSVAKGIDKLQEKGEIRRQCRKEADDKFGFPIQPKKIREKAAYRKKCKEEGGNDDFTSFTSDLLSNEGEIFAFNGHTF